jgi:SAM-dependent methyltransferase
MPQGIEVRWTTSSRRRPAAPVSYAFVQPLLAQSVRDDSLIARDVCVALTGFDQLVQEAAEASFEGWDFSWLSGRAAEERPPWDYDAEAARLLRTARHALDIDTGGGEVLLRLAPFSGAVVATEGYAPNIGVAARNLRPVGVRVVGTQSAPDNVDQYPRTSATPSSTSSHLPFVDGAFDVVVDRHSSYWPCEVARVLRPGGTFLTQQAGLGGSELLREFGRPVPAKPDFDLAFALGQLATAGLGVIRAEEVETPTRFFDVGALVYYLRAVPWLVPGFNVDADRDVLLRLHGEILKTGPVPVTGRRMLIEVRR